MGASGEFFIALFLAHSGAAQADAIHAFTHLLLYFAILFTNRIMRGNMISIEGKQQLYKRFNMLYASTVFIGLAWIVSDAIYKFMYYTQVVSGYMLLSVCVGISANIITLTIIRHLNKFRTDVETRDKSHKWLRLHALGDFLISVAVLLTAITSLMIPSLPLSYIDPTVTLGIAAGVGWSGHKIMRQS